MRALMQSIEAFFVKSRLRLPLYLLTGITGVGFFIAPELLNQPPVTSYLSKKVQLPLMIILSACVVIVGLFFLLVVVGVELAQFYN